MISNMVGRYAVVYNYNLASSDTLVKLYFESLVDFCIWLMQQLGFFAERTIDFAAVNLQKLKVKDLKAILSDWDEVCRGCTEKTDYIKLIEELMPRYEHAAWEKRQKAEL